jgi:hypothetical protein
MDHNLLFQLVAKNIMKSVEIVVLLITSLPVVMSS